MRTKEEEEQIEDALTYLVNQFEATGDNPKPVILHSTRLAMDLYDRGYSTAIVTAAFLHDLIEDTSVEADNIREDFDEHIVEIVQATSFDRRIEDRYERFEDTFSRCKDQGREALIVKAADILDNSDYYHLATSDEDREYLLSKMQRFIEIARSDIESEPIFEDVDEKQEVVKQRIKSAE